MGTGPTFTEEHRNVKYTNNVTASLRQEPGLLTALCGDSENYNGNKLARIENRFGRLRMRPKTTRHGDTNLSDISSLTRWIKPGASNNVAALLDMDDMDVTELELTSPLVKETAEAARTYHDDRVIEGYFGNAYTGETGQTAVPFTAANTIAHGGVGLTKAKLIALREKYRKLNVNLKSETPIVLLFPEDESALLNINEYVNYDYSSSRPLETGEIKPWMGFRFFPVNPSPEAFPDTYNLLTDGTTRFLPTFVPSGLHRGVWVEFWGKISERNDKDHDWQVFGKARSAVARTDENKCITLETR